MTGLGFLPDDNESTASDISSDGSFIVGYSTHVGKGSELVRWDNGIIASLGDSLISHHSLAFAVSDDGSVVVGSQNLGSGPESFRWEDGEVTYLGDLGGGPFTSQAECVSADGSVIAGSVTTADAPNEAFRWENGVMTGLGFLPGSGTLDSKAEGISGDGAVIVGRSDDDFGATAFIWDVENGMRSLQDILENDYGLDLTGWTLREAHGTSYDGLTIVGQGVGPNGSEAWVATIPEPTTLSLLALGTLAWRRRR